MTEARARHGVGAEAGGREAEQLACEALARDGWTVLRRRARTAAGEIDIVARRGGLIAFVEVKRRPTLAEAALALTPRQRNRLWQAAEILLAENPDWQTAALRFDLLLVDAAGQIRRIVDALRQDQ